MAQFDVHEVREGLVLDCQADRLATLPTRFVVPIVPYAQALNVDDWLTPALEVRERRMIMATQLAGTIARRELGAWVAAFVTEREQQIIQRALDTLFSRV